MAFAYEWIHYLTHTAYRPRGALYRGMWRYHRLHHFKNENYWQKDQPKLDEILYRVLPEEASLEDVYFALQEK